MFWVKNVWAKNVLGESIDKEKIDRKWPASSGRQFCVVLESLNFLELSALFIWRMPNDQIY